MSTAVDRNEDESRTATEAKAPVATASRDKVVEGTPTNEPGPDVVEQEATAPVDTDDPERDAAGEEFAEEVEMPPGEPIEYDDLEDRRAAISKNFQKRERDYVADENEVDDKTVEKTDSSANIEPDAPEMIEIKVNGRTRMVDKSKVDKVGGIQAYQKEVAVMEGFKDVKTGKEANARRSLELDARERVVRGKEAALPTLDEPKPDPDPPAQGDQSIGQLIKTYHDLLLDGEEEERDIALANLYKFNAGAKTQIDVEAMIEKAAVSAAKKIAKANRLDAEYEATQDLLQKHPELKTDERLFVAVDDEASIVQRENKDWKPDKVLTEAYKRVQEWRGPNRATTMNDKLEQKRGMNSPRVSTGRAVQAPEKPTRSNSEYVRQVRVSRGLE